MNQRPLHRRLFTATSLSLLLAMLGATSAWSLQEDARPRQIKRVRRPVFKPRDWDGIYFEDLFRDGLVGQRPEAIQPDQLAGQPGSASSDSGGVIGSTGKSGWSKLVSASTLEDEVKVQQQQLAVDITTPGKFKSDYAKVHQSFSMLSLLFAVVREYDADVRWKSDAALAQVSFERAAANSRVGTIQAYESCKRRRDDLEQLVRGGSFPESEKAPESLDWSLVVGHSPVMERLELAFKQLKTRTANKGDFTAGVAEVLHESEVVAILANAIEQPGMEYAAEESYVAFARKMKAAAVTIADSCRNQDYDAAALAVNQIGQACSNCHDEWR